MLDGLTLHLRQENFIKCPKRLEETVPPKPTNANYPYARAVRESKCQSNKLHDAEITYKEGNIEIVSQDDSKDNGLLRCLIGQLEGAKKEKPSLTEIGRWSSLLWKKAFGVNI